jgi:hypothetical protein
VYPQRVQKLLVILALSVTVLFGCSKQDNERAANVPTTTSDNGDANETVTVLSSPLEPATVTVTEAPIADVGKLGTTPGPAANNTAAPEPVVGMPGRLCDTPSAASGDLVCKNGRWEVAPLTGAGQCVEFLDFTRVFSDLSGKIWLYNGGTCFVARDRTPNDPPLNDFTKDGRNAIYDAQLSDSKVPFLKVLVYAFTDDKTQFFKGNFSELNVGQNGLALAYKADSYGTAQFPYGGVAVLTNQPIKCAGGQNCLIRIEVVVLKTAIDEQGSLAIAQSVLATASDPKWAQLLNR